MPCLQRASLASRLTKVSFSLDPPGEAPTCSFAELTSEWCHIRAMGGLRPTPGTDWPGAMIHLAASLESLYIWDGHPTESLALLDHMASWPAW